METELYEVHVYATGERIGSAKLTLQQYRQYEAMAQMPEGIIRLGALPHGWYDLAEDRQDTHEDVVVYLA